MTLFDGLYASIGERREEPRADLRAQLVRYFLYLGSLGFGGPAALIGYMQRDLVEAPAWFTLEEYKKGLALSQIAPGPLAAQLAICLGYIHWRRLGGHPVGLAFILPSYLMTVAIGAVYVRLRRARVDAGGLLRGGRDGDRHHRARGLEAEPRHRSGGTGCCGRSRRDERGVTVMTEIGERRSVPRRAACW